jgi:hypothetical protein
LLNDIVDENGEVVKKSLTTIPILDWLLTRVAKKGNITLSDNPDVPGANGISGTIKIAITAAIDQY